MPAPNFPPLHSTLKKPTPALPAPEPAPAPPPPPPPRVAVAPPPPPQAAPVPQPTAEAATYDPRDRVFYHRAALLFMGALRPASRVFHYEKGPDKKPVAPVDHDREQAKDAAHACAAVLDRGIVPKGFVLADILTLEGLIREREILDAGARREVLPYAQGHSVPFPQHNFAQPTLYSPSLTEKDRAQMKERLDAIPRLPSRDEAMAQNEEKLRGLADISETVRAHALDAAVIRLRGLGLTGAPGCRQDVIGVVVDAILDSIELAAQLGLPTRAASSYSEEESEIHGTMQYPYPAHLACDLAIVRDVAMAIKLKWVPNPDEDAAPESDEGSE